MAETEKEVFKVHIEGTIEAVWREITKTDEAQQAMFNSWMHTDGLKPGGQIRMRNANGRYTGVAGEIVDFDPPKKFSHTMRFTQYEDPPALITYLLEEKDGGVAFTLIADNLPAGTKSSKHMRQGGTFIVKTLKAIVENGRPPLGTRLLYVLFGLLEPLTPKRSRTENWPL